MDRPNSKELYGEKPLFLLYALHIAVAAVNGIDVIITWNFAHLNNPFRRRKVRNIVEAEGYSCPEVCSPEELLEVER